jgi:hypothetical protein
MGIYTMTRFTEQEIAEVDEAPILEAVPPGYVVPKMERDS